MIGNEVTIVTQTDEVIMGTIKDFDKYKIEFDKITLYDKATDEHKEILHVHVYWECVVSLTVDDE